MILKNCEPRSTWSVDKLNEFLTKCLVIYCVDLCLLCCYTYTTTFFCVFQIYWASWKEHPCLFYVAVEHFINLFNDGTEILIFWQETIQKWSMVNGLHFKNGCEALLEILAMIMSKFRWQTARSLSSLL